MADDELAAKTCEFALEVADRGTGLHHREEIEIDAQGQSVAPGFINMLSWANESLIQDGRSLSDIRQGVTLEVMGEGNSMGPLNAAMKQEMLDRQSDIRFDVEWTTLGEYLEYLERRGISPNVASFIGAENPREYVIGHEDRPPTPEELDEMREIVATIQREQDVVIRSDIDQAVIDRALDLYDGFDDPARPVPVVGGSRWRAAGPAITADRVSARSVRE